MLTIPISRGGLLYRAIAAFAGMLLLIISVACQAKSLYWQSLDVAAELDAAGGLHVVERQHMVFDGDWNGGERIFRLGFGQRLELLGMKRIDPLSGAVTVMRSGDLAEINHYQQVSDKKLRWRSRRTTDPQFHNTGIIYEIDYRLTGILQKQGDQYRLNHDFAFSDRDGDIRRFSLRLTLDPAWSANVSLPLIIERNHLPPGRGVIVTLPLSYQGAQPPALLTSEVAAGWLWLIGVLFISLLAWRLSAYIRYEKHHVRFQQLAVPGRIDDAWLQQHVFIYPAEKVASLWDAKAGPAEVAAMLARLVQDGYLKSHVETRGWWLFKRQVLHLQRLRPLHDFSRYEQKLLKALFVTDDQERTDTDSVAAYYKARRRGFDPVTKIRGALSERGRETRYYRKHNRHGWRLTLALAASGVLMIAPALVDNRDLLVSIIPLLVLTLVFGFVLWMRAGDCRREVETPVGCSLVMLLIYLLYVALVTAVLIFSHAFLPLAGYAGAMLLSVALFNHTLNAMKTRVSKRRIKLRKQLAAVRRYFINELGRQQPRLQDAWYPYLIGFELQGNMDKWFRAYAGAASGIHGSYQGGSMASGTSGWSGGGGSFGGAGASGAWASAASTLSAGVAAPSSSSSGGGGGSSGGGGGGGW
jgi:hypothetical protein